MLVNLEYEELLGKSAFRSERAYSIWQHGRSFGNTSLPIPGMQRSNLHCVLVYSRLHCTRWHLRPYCNNNHLNKLRKPSDVDINRCQPNSTFSPTHHTSSYCALYTRLLEQASQTAYGDRKNVCLQVLTYHRISTDDDARQGGEEHLTKTKRCGKHPRRTHSAPRFDFLPC